MKKLLVLVLIAGAFGGGYWYAKRETRGSASKERKVLYWVDPMHPWYKSDKPGIAPDCNMALEPVYEGETGKYEKAGNEPAGTVEITPEKQQLIGVEFGTPEYRTATDSIRAAARVTFDETRISKVQSRIEGWIDKVFIDFTGKQVEKGQPLLTIYSPEALATQQEFLLAVRAQKEMAASPVHELMHTTENMLGAARKRMQLWDISDEQIARVASTGKPIEQLTLYAPASGFVTERNAFPRQRINADTVLYTVVDLSSVWVVADVFEYESANIKVGQPAVLTLAYLPGREFRGHVSYILPQVDAATRTLKVRLQFENPGYSLKPEMYGNVELKTGGSRRLTVPQSAVLDSGQKQVIFVDRGNGRFEPREVKTGGQSGDRVEILAGLRQGERIVTSGNFLIDSESQLKAAMAGSAGARK